MEEKQEKKTFDYESFRQQAIGRLMSGDKELGGKDGVLAPLLKDLLDAVLSGEAQAHIEEHRPNRRNGSKSKRVKTAHGPIDVQVPRDREGSFEPKLIAKRQTTLGEGLDNRILSLYSKGMFYRKIVYTTNTVEAFHRQIRSVTKSTGAFSSETALVKLLYLTTQRIIDKWKIPLANWSITVQQLAILYDDRIKQYMKV